MRKASLSGNDFGSFPKIQTVISVGTKFSQQVTPHMMSLKKSLKGNSALMNADKIQPRGKAAGLPSGF